jgi:hypothetical protein
MSSGSDRSPVDPSDPLDPSRDPDGAAGVTPEFAGSADTGVVDSVGEHHPMAGDAADVLRAELGKLLALHDEVVAMLVAGALEEFAQRWYGVVRETLEFEAALARVVVPELGSDPGSNDLPDGADPGALVERLRPYDELNSGRSADELRRVADENVETLRAQQRSLLPAVERLDADVRERLGEDLRQVMG